MTFRLEDAPILIDDEGRVVPGPTYNDMADQLEVFISELQLHRPDLYAEHQETLEECAAVIREFGDQPI